MGLGIIPGRTIRAAGLATDQDLTARRLRQTRSAGSRWSEGGTQMAGIAPGSLARSVACGQDQLATPAI